MLKKSIVFSILLFIVACRTKRANILLKQIDISHIGDCNYEKESNYSSIDISINKEGYVKNGIILKSKFDSYSPSKKPITMRFTRCNHLVLIYNQKGKKFILGNMNDIEKNCNYNCQLNFNPTDKISFKSSLGLFPYWHGFSVLGGLPLIYALPLLHFKSKKEKW